MKNNSGFTIMEMMVVIGVISILSAIAVPNMIRWRNNMQFNSSIRMLKSTIESTRMAAIKSNMPARLDFTDGGQSFDSVKWDMVANAFAAPESHQLPPGVIIVDSNFAGDELRFTSRGMPANAFGGTLTLENASGDLCRRIVVANIGSARIDDCP